MWILLILINYFWQFRSQINNDSLLNLALRSNWHLTFTPSLFRRDYNKAAQRTQDTNYRILQHGKMCFFLSSTTHVIPLIRHKFSWINWLYSSGKKKLLLVCGLLAIYSILTAQTMKVWSVFSGNAQFRHHRTCIALWPQNINSFTDIDEMRTRILLWFLSQSKFEL